MIHVSVLPVPNRVVNVGFDVGAASLNWMFFLDQQEASGECLNRTDDIRSTLQQIHQRVEQQSGPCELRIICESTGVYHRSLLKVASQLGMRTSIASGESVAHCRKLAQGDTNKTDLADPKAILTVARVGRLMIHRELDGPFEELRELHRVLLSNERKIREIKNELRAEMKILFPDLSLAKEVCWGPTGRALFLLYGMNPAKIVAAGRADFDSQMKANAKFIKTKTRDKIWSMANETLSQEPSANTARICEEQVRFSFDLLVRLTLKKQQLEAEMITLYRELQSSGVSLPEPEHGVLSERLLARLFAEIGPPTDFQTVRQLYRYAGLNLLERQSGKYRGKTKIGRRGRSAIRDILNRMSLPLVKKIGLFGDYYHAKKDRGMPGNKAMVAVMRKVLKMVYGLCRTGEAYDQQRVHRSRKEYDKLVA